MGKKLATRSTKTLPFLHLCCIVLVAFSCLWLSEAKFRHGRRQKGYEKVVIVDPSGHGNFSKIQSAIDSVPPNNDKWVLIRIRAGTYREKVKIPHEKPFIVMIGEGKTKTEIVWADHDSLAQSPTFASMADNILIKSMTFTNSYNFPSGGKNRNPRVPAVAGMIAGDKSAFFDVGFKGLQDTLWDCNGRHLFRGCTIQGAVDFIFGSGQSIYEKSEIQVLGNELEPGVAGFITAQGRTNPGDANGFVFRDCTVTGTGKAYLGRPWRDYARVVFYNSHLSGIIVPSGWNSWNVAGHEDRLTFVEQDCHGKGANMTGRVRWLKPIHVDATRTLADLSFIDKDGWTRHLHHLK